MKVATRMMTVGIVLIASLPLTQSANAGEPGFGGTLVYDNGRTVAFERLTLTEGGAPMTFTVEGHVGQQRVEYAFSELKSIEFADYRTAPYFQDRRGDLIVTGKTGKQVTLTDAYVYCGDHKGVGAIFYQYNDPVTGKIKHQVQRIHKRIARITIGKHQGRLKKNSATGDYYPASYQFDPFSGKKLIWSERNADATE